jgi:regulatory protein
VGARRGGERTGARARKPDPTPLDVAAGVLRVAPRTAAELEQRLVAKGYAPETAARTVARCRELGWVNDETLALDRARVLRARGHGPLRIAAELEARGLPAALVDHAVDGSRDGASESAWARRALQAAGEPTGAKAWRLLTSRGFPEDVATDLLGDPSA